MQFFLHLGAVIHRLAYFIFDDFAKAAAESVNGHFDRAFVQVELAGGLGLRNVFGVAGQPGFERFELVLIEMKCSYLFLRRLWAKVTRNITFKEDGNLQRPKSFQPRISRLLRHQKTCLTRRFHRLTPSSFWNRWAAGVVS